MARFHLDHQVIIVQHFAHAHKLHRRFHHTLRGIAITTHDPVAQRSMIGSYTHGSAILFKNLHQWRKLLVDTFQFTLVFGIRIIYLVEFLFISIITRIYAHFFYYARSHLGSIWGKMDI